MIGKANQPLSRFLGIPVGPDLIVKRDTHLLGLPLFTSKDVNHAVVVIAGTGSVVISFKERIVEHARVGGRGWILGSKRRRI
jgi:N-acetylglucosamine kinase-like BadF-type ATPase